MHSDKNYNERIDFILFENGFRPIVADKQADRTLITLWPSDHDE